MNKLRNFSILLMTALVLAAFAVFPAGATSRHLTAVANSSEVSIHSGAGGEYEVIATTAQKATLTIASGKLYSKEWYKVILPNGAEGYVNSGFITFKKNQFYIPAKLTGYAGYTRKIPDIINTTGKDIVWTSSDPRIAEVSSKGRITCVKAGECSISAEAGEKQLSLKLSVVNADVKLSQNTATIKDDENLDLKAECKKSVVFSSSDDGVASVSSTGVVTPKVKSGKVRITANSKSGSDECVVTIKERVISLKATRRVMYEGCHAILTASGGKKGGYSFKSLNTSILTVDKNGIVTAAGPGKAYISCTYGNASTKLKFKVVSGSSVNISNTSASLRKDMTLYLKSRTSGVTWSSSDSSIAYVNNGYVLGQKKGTAIISAKTSYGERDCVVTVKAPEAVRFCYTSENSAKLGQNVRFYAITDKLRTAAQFKVEAPDGEVFYITETEKKEKSGRFIWIGSRALDRAGDYKITAYSKTSDTAEWKTSPGGCAETFVNESSSRTATSYGKRRATTRLIKNIATYEGFLPYVTMDPLVSDAPTLGYGRVVYAGSTFYNGMTKNEAFAYLVQTVNDSGFTTQVNKLLTENKIKFNQSHFDALVNFSYNLGAYAITNHSDLLGVLTNSYGKAEYKNTAFVNKTGVCLLEKPEEGSKVLAELKPFKLVRLIDKENGYRKVKCGGKVGYIKSKYLTGRTGNTKVRNLKNVSLTDFKNAFLPYHHAGSECYWGLLYRRVDETETFFFNDYEVDGRSNKYGITYTCPRYSEFTIG